MNSKELKEQIEISIASALEGKRVKEGLARLEVNQIINDAGSVCRDSG